MRLSWYVILTVALAVTVAGVMDWALNQYVLLYQWHYAQPHELSGRQNQNKDGSIHSLPRQAGNGTLPAQDPATAESEQP